MESREKSLPVHVLLPLLRGIGVPGAVRRPFLPAARIQRRADRPVGRDGAAHHPRQRAAVDGRRRRDTAAPAPHEPRHRGRRRHGAGFPQPQNAWPCDRASRPVFLLHCAGLVLCRQRDDEHVGRPEGSIRPRPDRRHLRLGDLRAGRGDRDPGLRSETGVLGLCGADVPGAARLPTLRLQPRRQRASRCAAVSAR